MKCYYCAGIQIFLHRILTTYPSNQCGLKKGSPSGVKRTPGQDKTCNWARRRSRCPGITHGTVNGFAPATLDCDLFRAPNTNLLIYLFHFHFSRFVCSYSFGFVCKREHVRGIPVPNFCLVILRKNNSLWKIKIISKQLFWWTPVVSVLT